MKESRKKSRAPKGRHMRGEEEARRPAKREEKREEKRVEDAGRRCGSEQKKRTGERLWCDPSSPAPSHNNNKEKKREKVKSGR